MLLFQTPRTASLLTLSSSPVNSLLDEPDYVASLLVDHCDRLRIPLSSAGTTNPQQTKVIQRAAPFLDTLAQLLVCEEQKQVIALSVLFDCPRDAPESRLRFVVAQNDAVPECVPEHLRFILGKLSVARGNAIDRLAAKAAELNERVNEKMNQELDEDTDKENKAADKETTKKSPSLGLPSMIIPTTSDPLELELLDLEYGLFRYSWKTVHQRLVGDDRYPLFHTLARDRARSRQSHGGGASSPLEDAEPARGQR
ncbi:hypothetical protein C8Q76DRAFT_215803 [Earliella scabrosa]|nr:hypothetical protein C8Q76DRAFT_215803 [Earliella scabrosa]